MWVGQQCTSARVLTVQKMMSGLTSPEADFWTGIASVQSVTREGSCHRAGGELPIRRLKFPPDETVQGFEAHSQAGFGSCFSEMDTGASESFLLIKFIAA